jgi:hypothetical protein
MVVNLLYYLVVFMRGLVCDFYLLYFHATIVLSPHISICIHLHAAQGYTYGYPHPGPDIL